MQPKTWGMGMSYRLATLLYRGLYSCCITSGSDTYQISGTF